MCVENQDEKDDNKYQDTTSVCRKKYDDKDYENFRTLLVCAENYDDKDYENFRTLLGYAGIKGSKVIKRGAAGKIGPCKYDDDLEIHCFNDDFDYDDDDDDDDEATLL